jgi:Leucine-rich repeat (LRR) protein
MKKIDWLITIATFVFSYLFYRQITGINYLVFSIALSAGYLVLNKDLLKNRNWMLFSITSLLSSFFIMWHHSDLAVWATICSLLLQSAYALKGNASVLSNGFYAVYSIGGAMVFFIINLVTRDTKKEEGKTSKRGINYLIGLGVFVIVLIFFLIYKNANPLFEKYTEKINLDFISGPWIAFTIMGFFIIYGLIRNQRINAIDNFEDSLLLSLIKTDKTSKSFERPAGIALFLLLNVMLLFINILDVVYLYVLKQLPEGISHTQFVHNGVGMLILSIVLGITIILVLFRNALNFEENNKLIKTLVAFWIIQNIVMIVSTCVRNQIYVTEFNFTYKRIGVFVYLILASFGLITTLYKVYYKKSNWYLVKTNSLIGVLFLCGAASVDWDKQINQFNISHKQNKLIALDKKYLLGLSEISIPYLQKIKSHPTFNTDSVKLNDLRGIDSFSGEFNNYAYNLNSEELDKKTYEFLKKQHKYSSWQSWNQRDQYILSELSALNEKNEIKTLSIKNQELDSIGLLEIFHNVTDVNLTGSFGNQYGFLSGYKQLKNLDLSFNHLETLTKVPASKSLESINLSNNLVKELSALNSFEQLKTLNVSNNQFNVLSSIPTNSTIETLDISSNKQLFDLSGIEKLKSLKKLDASFIYRIDRFPYSNKLEVLSLTHIDDISRTLLHIPIHNSLKQLDLSYNQNPNLNYLIVHNKAANTYLLRFPNLQSLKLVDCSLTGAFDLQNYNQITELDLSSNKLIGTSFLINYDKLNSLSISSNELETLTFSPKQNTIKTLNISYNPKLEDFIGLKELNNLENLYVSNTQFNDLSLLTCQNTLYNLDINYCKIKNFNLLENFKKLRTISLNEPKPNEIHLLNKLPNLKVINIKQNTLISDKQKQDLKQQLKNKQVNFI